MNSKNEKNQQSQKKYTLSNGTPSKQMSIKVNSTNCKVFDRLQGLSQNLSNFEMIDFQLKREDLERQIEHHQQFYLDLNEFHFNIYDFSQAVGRNMQMPFMAVGLFKQNNLLDLVNFEKFMLFITEIYNGYNRNVQYHNDLHGSDVAQHCNVILNKQGLSKYAKFDKTDVLAILTSALCHDVDHDGFNNRYHIITQSPVFKEFGKDHVLENLHAAITLRLLDEPALNFMEDNFSHEEIKMIKKRVMESIIFTDMATSKQLRDDFQEHLDRQNISKGVNAENLIDMTSTQSIEKSKQLLTNVVLHGCDISTSLREFDLSTNWADNLFQEFFNQGDVEKSKGLEVSMMCDRDTTNIAKGQAGFISFCVLPIFYQLGEVCTNVHQLQIASGNANIEKWKKRVAMEEAQENGVLSNSSKADSQKVAS